MSRVRFAVAVLMLAACEAKKRNAPLADQTASITVVSAADGGQATTAVMIGDTDAFPLPIGDRPALGRQPEMRARGVYLVRLEDGSSRPAYLGTVSLFFGPKLTPEQARASITFLSGASLAWSDPALRGKVLQVARERALGEVPALLTQVSDQPGAEWRAAFLALPGAEQALVQRELAPALAGRAPERLLAAALVTDLAGDFESVSQRIVERGVGLDHLAMALLLRSLPSGVSRAALACNVLSDPAALPHGDPLLGAALGSLREKTAPCLDSVRTIVIRDACATDARCLGGAPVGAGATDQNEPVCTKDELLRATEHEARRSKWDVAAEPSAPTTALALAVLQQGPKGVPAAFVTAHARRRYAIDQHGAACAQARAASAACTMDEAELRFAACSTAGVRGTRAP